ncbi:hypothetical protein C8R44DRAFT_341920 [Mycena epipterygia]|nr:hypothetical protein C8R44DRAFT_341920 [Mycena epipterygia]
MVLSVKSATLAVLAAVFVSNANAENHTVTFINNCGFGTPMLIQGSNVLSTGAPFVIDGPLIGASAYLQTGACGFNGEDCTLVETTLINPTFPGGGSSTDISLLSPHAFSVTTGFRYFGGCQPAGADCTSANCVEAFHEQGDPPVQVPCELDNAGLTITFCD